MLNKKFYGLCYFVFMMLGVYLSTYQSVINVIADKFSLDSRQAGSIIALHFCGALIAPLVFGEISEKIGKKTVVTIAIVFLCVANLLIFLSPGLLLISLGIFIGGCGFSVIEGTLSGFMADLDTENAGKVINLTQMYLSIGALAGPIMSTSFSGAIGNWKMSFMIIAIALLLAAVGIARYRIGAKSIVSVEVKARGSGLVTFNLLKQRIFIYLCIAILLYVGIEEATAFWMTTYFGESIGHGNMGAFALSGYWGSMIIGRYLASRFQKRMHLLMMAGLILSFVSFCLVLIYKNSYMDFILFTLVGLGFSIIWPALITYTAHLYSENTGAAFGVMMTASAVGAILVPMLIGMIAVDGGVSKALWIVPIIIFGIYIFNMKIKRQLL